MIFPFSESRFPVGSSPRITLALEPSARAMATRCCSPPESIPGNWRNCFSWIPTWVSRSLAVCKTCLRFSPWISMGYSTFSKAVSWGNRL